MMSLCYNVYCLFQNLTSLRTLSLTSLRTLSLTSLRTLSLTSLRSTNIATNNNDVPLENNCHLPIGFRVLSCNRCLADNWFEYVFSSIETVALTKVIHLCDLEVVASKDDDEPRNSPILIKEEQNTLMVHLRRAVNFLS